MRSPNGSRERGHALAATILLVIAMTGLATAMMLTALQDRQQTRAATELTQSHYVAEAGINRAIIDLATGGDGVLGTEEAPVEFSGGRYWTEVVDQGGGMYQITSRARLASERDAIEVVIDPIRVSFFTKGLFGDLDLGASGSVFTDSYDSALGSYASQAVNVHPVTGDTYAGTKGSLGSNGDITIRGSVVVLGDATPGPGHTVTISGGGVHVEGSTAPAVSVSPMFPIDFTPTVASSGPLSASGGNMDIAAGTHRYDSMALAGSATVTIKGDVILYIDGDFLMTAKSKVIIESGARLTVYHAGTDFKMTGHGLLNLSDTPRNFVLYSKATDVKLTGSSGFYGSVYAPSAVIEPVGTSALYGSLVGSQIYVGGTADFHFDEALSRAPELGFAGSYRIVSWRRVGFESVTEAP